MPPGRRRSDDAFENAAKEVARREEAGHPPGARAPFEAKIGELDADVIGNL